MFEGVHIPRTELKSSAEKQIEDKGPFPSEAIRKNTKDDLKEWKGVSIYLPEKREEVIGMNRYLARSQN